MVQSRPDAAHAVPVRISTNLSLALSDEARAEAAAPARVLFEVFEPCDGTYIGFATLQTRADVLAGRGTDTTAKAMVFLPEARAQAAALGVDFEITMVLPRTAVA